MIIYLIIVIAILHWLRQQRGNGNEPPAYPKALPIIGHNYLVPGSAKAAWEIAKEVMSCSQKNGGVVRIFAVGSTYYHITDPDDAMTLATTCLAKYDYYDLIKPFCGDSLLVASVEKWKPNRKKLTPAFHPNVLNGFYTALNNQSQKLVDVFDGMVGKGFFDLTDVIKLNALETICLTVLGLDYSDHSLLNNKYIEAGHEMISVTMRRALLLLLKDWMFNLTPLKTRMDKCMQTIHNMTETVIKRRKAEIKNNLASDNVQQKNLGSKFKPFMDLLLEMDSITDQEIRDELNLMIFASHDTSSITMLFALHEIATNPEIQRKLHEEVDAVFGNSTECFVDKAVNSELVYVEAVIKETLRLYPVAPLIARNIDKDVDLKKYRLPKGSYGVLGLYQLNRHPMWGADAEQFRPERWLEPGGVPDHPAAFVSFGVGRRNCIGKGYALMSMRVTLAHLMRNFTFISENSKFELKLEILLKPASGHHISIKRRIPETKFPTITSQKG